MKINAEEYDGCFAFNFEAETVEDVMFLVRFGLNRTKELKSSGAVFPRTGVAQGYITLGKRKEPSSNL